MCLQCIHKQKYIHCKAGNDRLGHTTQVASALNPEDRNRVQSGNSMSHGVYAGFALEPIDESGLRSLRPPFELNSNRTLSTCNENVPRNASMELSFFFTSSITACGKACNEFNANLTTSSTALGNFDGTKYYCNLAEWSTRPERYGGINCWLRVANDTCSKPPASSIPRADVFMITYFTRNDNTCAPTDKQFACQCHTVHGKTVEAQWCYQLVKRV